jgi:hypothetical protein
MRSITAVEHIHDIAVGRVGYELKYGSSYMLSQCKE